jgi:membrane protease YdiL (CAAX protease family)
MGFWKSSSGAARISNKRKVVLTSKLSAWRSLAFWHVPLTLAHGVAYEGGAFALVGGAIGLGVFWSVIAYQTGRIGWPIVSHVVTNVATFVGLISSDFV